MKTLPAHILEEIEARGPITGLDFHERMRERDLRWWQRLYLVFISPYVLLADLEDAGLVEGYRELRQTKMPTGRYNTRLVYRLREDRVRA